MQTKVQNTTQIKKKNNNPLRNAIPYILLVILGVIMIYPLLWMFAASFRETKDIFNSIGIIPPTLDIQYYISGWAGVGEYTFTRFFANTFAFVIPQTIFIVFSCSIVAYGFARFEFPMKKILFGAMMATLMLPSSVIMIPRYLLFRDFNWLDSYLPFIVPALFAGNSFFIFQMVQFMRGVPKELDEAAYIDGCGSFAIFKLVLLPLCKPALISIALFNFIWSWNSFLDPLIYLSSVSKYTLSLALRMTLDLGSAAAWNEIFAMSVLAIAPPVIIFFSAQNYFIEGISTSGLKG